MLKLRIFPKRVQGRLWWCIDCRSHWMAGPSPEDVFRYWARVTCIVL